MNDVTEFIPGYWICSESGAFFELYGCAHKYQTIVCLRRQLPSWWTNVKHISCDAAFIHHPVPSSNRTIRCRMSIVELFDKHLMLFKQPVLLFCKEGRNRSGIICGLIKFVLTSSEKEALFIYGHVAKDKARNGDIVILQELCDIAMGKQWIS